MRALFLECTDSDYDLIASEIARWSVQSNQPVEDGNCVSGAAIAAMIEDLKFYRDLYEKEGRTKPQGAS